MDEALEIIGRPLDAERLDHEGRFFRARAAYLYTRAARRPPLPRGLRRRRPGDLTRHEDPH